jgi:membrane protein implicated in regulation of membrane protease activity
MDVVLWVILGVALAIAEIFTTTLFLLMFSVGAVAAAAAAAMGAGIPVQAGVFVAVSALTIAALRPVLRRHLNQPGPVEAGLAPMQGLSAVVVEQVDTGRGMVRIDGELWQARSLEGFGTYAPGERVRVVHVEEGVAVVWREGVTGIAEHQL